MVYFTFMNKKKKIRPKHWQLVDSLQDSFQWFNFTRINSKNNSVFFPLELIICTVRIICIYCLRWKITEKKKSSQLFSVVFRWFSIPVGQKNLLLCLLGSRIWVKIAISVDFFIIGLYFERKWKTKIKNKLFDKFRGIPLFC